MSAEKTASCDVPLIAHVIFRLAVGGLENGLTNLINLIPEDRYRHAIVCITHATNFRERIERPNVEIIELNKKDGKDPAVYWRMWTALKTLRPDIVHTRNANAIEFQFIAALAGARHRIHGEHGWDMHDIDGTSRKYRMLRKLLSPLVHQFIAVSQDLESYLIDSLGVKLEKVEQINNGVDFAKIRQRALEDCRPPWCYEMDEDPLVIGTVGRMQTVKNQILLVRVFSKIVESRPELRNRLRLLMVGDGPLQDEITRELKRRGIFDLAWLPGAREDVAALMAKIDVFVLPSINEGISNTILEAMALGIPVVATRVGGNKEVVMQDETGMLVALDDVAEMAAAILQYVAEPELRLAHGNAGRRIVEERYSLERMVNGYLSVYDKVLGLPYRAGQSPVT